MFKDIGGDLVLFASPALENANMTVLHCREVMERTGMTEEAKRLTGLEVTSRGMAQVALEMLNSMKTRAEAEYAKQIAINSLLMAVGPIHRS